MNQSKETNMHMNRTVRIEKAKPTDPDYGFAIHLMQFLVVPAFVLDAQGKVLIWNNACERLTGIRASEVFGTSEHWRGFYETPRACLADLVIQQRVTEIYDLYAKHDETTNQAHGVHAENWCVNPPYGE